MKRPPVRLRLALTHAALFLALGCLLLGVNLLMVKEALSPRIEQAVIEEGGAQGALSQADAPGIGTTIDAITVDTLVTRSGIALAGSAVLVGVFSWWIAGRSLRPITQMTSLARSLSDRTLHQRIDLSGPADELKELADTIDDMLGRLDDVFDGQRRFVANASHELRTPLAIARTAVEVYRAKPLPTPRDAEVAMAKVGEAVDRSERLIAALLTLARAEHLGMVTDVELGELLAAVVDECGAPIVLSLHPATVRGDAALLERMVANLLDNAVAHGEGTGVVAQVETADHVVRLVVENGGPQIDPSRVPGLFAPFVRLDPQRNSSSGGVGLGLSIVETIVRAHGGSVDAEARREGGLRICVTLPSCPHRP